jgi:hypothetical protein
MVDQIFAVTKGFLQGRRPHVLVLTSPNVTAAELVHGDWDFVICTVQCLCLMDQINLCLTQLTVGNYPDVQDPVSPPSLFYLGLTPLGSLPTANLYCRHPARPSNIEDYTASLCHAFADAIIVDFLLQFSLLSIGGTPPDQHRIYLHILWRISWRQLVASLATRLSKSRAFHAIRWFPVTWNAA